MNSIERNRCWLSIVIGLAAMSGCEAPGPSAPNPPPGQTARSAKPAPASASSGSVRAGGVPWTIQVIEMEGPYAARHCERMADTLRSVPGLDRKAVWVAHEPDGFSRVYYGSYPTRLVEATGKRFFPAQMDKDFNLIRQLRFDDGASYFALARRVRKPVPDTGRPEWSLTRLDKPYTLQVAVFEADVVENYKQAAADYCAALRQHGYEAYYYHASVSSMVTVGGFGRDDVRLESGKLLYGPRILELQRDEALAFNYVNGEKVNVVTDGKRVGVPSQLVLVPGHEDAQLMKDAEYRPEKGR